MQERVSFFCFETQSWIRGVRLTTEKCARIQGLVCSFNLIVPSGEAHVDRLDGSVMECVNCSSFETGGCGRMERFQKSCRCVMADCCTCLFSQPCLLGTSAEFLLVVGSSFGVSFGFFSKKIYSAITQKASSAWLSGSRVLWSVVTILSDQKISLCIAFQEFELIPCLAKNRFPCLQKLSKSLICLYRKQSWPDLMAINNLPLARYLEMHHRNVSHKSSERPGPGK